MFSKEQEQHYAPGREKNVNTSQLIWMTKFRPLFSVYQRYLELKSPARSFGVGRVQSFSRKARSQDRTLIYADLLCSQACIAR